MMFYFALCELLNEQYVEEISASLAFAFSLCSGLGFWTIYLLLCVTCSDPGIVLPLKNDFSRGFFMMCLDLDEHEKAAFDQKDPVYKDAAYYQFRNCSTCKQTRTPKASHCGACGYCVQGWDHHCTALNNCIGHRNMRSFVAFLICSFTFAATILVSCLYLLLVGRPGYSESSFKLRVGASISAVLSFITFWIAIRPYLTNRKRMAVLAFGTLVSLTSSLVYIKGVVQF